MSGKKVTSNSAYKSSGPGKRFVIKKGDFKETDEIKDSAYAKAKMADQAKLRIVKDRICIKPEIISKTKSLIPIPISNRSAPTVVENNAKSKVGYVKTIMNQKNIARKNQDNIGVKKQGRKGEICLHAICRLSHIHLDLLRQGKSG